MHVERLQKQSPDKESVGENWQAPSRALGSVSDPATRYYYQVLLSLERQVRWRNLAAIAASLSLDWAQWAAAWRLSW